MSNSNYDPSNNNKEEVIKEGEEPLSNHSFSITRPSDSPFGGRMAEARKRKDAPSEEEFLDQLKKHRILIL